MTQLPADLLLPWHRPLWERFTTLRAQERLPHAILLSGRPGLGKAHLARLLAHSLLCSENRTDGTPCGHCRSCLLIKAGSHPDLLSVTIEEGKQRISIDQIRAVGEFQGLKAHYPQGKVVLVEPAEAMNAYAANALLKTLEEPSGDTVLLLVSHAPNQLLPTVRSRCQRVDLHGISDEGVIREWWAQQEGAGEGEPGRWLRLAQGAPLRALELARREGIDREQLFADLTAVSDGQADPVAIAAKWEKADLQGLLAWWHSFVADMVKLHWLEGGAEVTNLDIVQRLQKLGKTIDLATLYRILDLLQEGRRILQGQVNRLLALEYLLLVWSHAGKRSSAKG